MRSLEKTLLIIVWIASFISIWFIPKKKIAQASFIFLSAQLPTWILGLVVVEAGWLEYPVRELSKANSTSFTYEYLILPIVCIFFNLYYPDGKANKQKLLYYFLFSSALTLLEIVLEKYTLLIKYSEWRWYWTWISLILLFYIVRVVYKWFFKAQKPFYL